jgi:osmotically-inducible protein OsmY
LPISRRRSWRVDRLRVKPAQRMTDEEIRTAVRDVLLEERALSECRIWETVANRCEVVREPAASVGIIEIRVEGSVVTLDGDVPGLAHKRLAGVLAWWAPGSRDVVNGLGVTPPEADSDDEITDAVRIALEKDPFVNAAQIRVGTRSAAVILQGLVPTPSEREMAEFDAWYVFGVDKVINQIEVRP